MEDFVPMRLVRTGSTASGRSSDSGEHRKESQKIQATSMEWTDEKHSLYLKSMEASFLDQLYSTSDVNDWHSHKDGLADTLSSRKMHANTGIPSGQFKVLQGGCWSKRNFRRDESKMSKAERSCALPPSPWIRHFKAGSRQHALPEAGIPGKTAPALQQFIVCGDYLCRQDLTRNTEVSDQNFPDEDVSKERTSRVSTAKRMRTSVVSRSSNDQVVPLGFFPMMEDIAKNQTPLR